MTINDAPDIRRAQRTGYPGGEHRRRWCPVCGEELDATMTVYFNDAGEIAGCSKCLRGVDAEEYLNELN